MIIGTQSINMSCPYYIYSRENNFYRLKMRLAYLLKISLCVDLVELEYHGSFFYDKNV
jgi:hypothetical protein